MRIGSLFSGAGGLDMAVEQVFGGEVIWQSELDKSASKVLAYRYPCAPNLGDITAVDWSTVETPDVLCGGFPCQDVSSAGKRAGIKDGTRSGLWSVFADIIDTLRPPIVIIENVRGLLSATAHRNMEPDRATLGNGTDGPVLRAAGAVLGDLADLGYDAQWTTLAAGDVGAPHRRERVFIVAHAAGQRPEERGQSSRVGAPQSGLGSSDLSLQSVDLLPTPCASDSSGGGMHPDTRVGHSKQLIDYVHLLCTPAASDGAGGKTSRSGGRIDEPLLGGQAREMATAWGKYEPAIRRWESLTRPAPAPTEPNKNGNPRLSAAFSEWLMGWPVGWVTDPDIGISRNNQLKIIGNGVCPQQATAALTYLLTIQGENT